MFQLDFNFRKEGNATVNAVCDDKIAVLRCNWSAFAKEQERILYNIG
jgi:hypothetical protein